MIQIGSRVRAAVDLFTDDEVNYEVAKGTLGTVVAYGAVWDWKVQFDGESAPDPVHHEEIEEVEG